jgi:hypothetical protein
MIAECCFVGEQNSGRYAGVIKVLVSLKIISNCDDCWVAGNTIANYREANRLKLSITEESEGLSALPTHISTIQSQLNWQCPDSSRVVYIPALVERGDEDDPRNTSTKLVHFRNKFDSETD